jgi:spore coat polysaccharide biosynthesis protein SpsF (cytidylyltransferase family)
VQARIASNRFPGTARSDLAGMSLIDWVLSRVAHSIPIDLFLLVAIDRDICDSLTQQESGLGVAIYGGDECDILYCTHVIPLQARPKLSMRPLFSIPGTVSIVR